MLETSQVLDTELVDGSETSNMDNDDQPKQAVPG